jgi:hypothetical protein
VSFGLVATLCLDQFVFGAQPIIEVVSHLTPSFLEELVRAVSDSVWFGESCSSGRWSLTVSRMFFVLGVCRHDASSSALIVQRRLELLGVLEALRMQRAAQGCRHQRPPPPRGS